MAVEFYWDPNVQRYRYVDTGQFVSKSAMLNLTQKAILQYGQDIRAIGNSLVDGNISLAQWEQDTAQAIKNMTIQQYALGKGGIAQMTQRDYGIIGNTLKQQYAYLRNFSNSLASQGLTTAQFQARLQMYVNATTQAYERARVESHIAEGYLYERRIRTKIESCSPCITYEGMGWQPIGTLPNQGQNCDCLSNCGCYKEFSKDNPNQSMLRPFGWLRGNLRIQFSHPQRYG